MIHVQKTRTRYVIFINTRDISQYEYKRYIASGYIFMGYPVYTYNKDLSYYTINHTGILCNSRGSTIRIHEVCFAIVLSRKIYNHNKHTRTEK